MCRTIRCRYRVEVLTRINGNAFEENGVVPSLDIPIFSYIQVTSQETRATLRQNSTHRMCLVADPSFVNEHAAGYVSPALINKL